MITNKNRQMTVKLIFIVLIAILANSSCSPKMHLIGLGMRTFNLSQNKYSKKHPYIKNEHENRKQKKRNKN